MPTNCTLTFFLFYRGHWIAFQIMPKRGKVVVHDSCDWETDKYQEFIDLIQLWVNFLSSIWTSVSCVSREICLHKLTFHIFNLKQGIQVQLSKRTSLSRRQSNANVFSHKFSEPHATGRFRVLWVLPMRECEAVREIHYWSRTHKGLLFITDRCLHIVYYCNYKLLNFIMYSIIAAWPEETRRPAPRETTSKCSRWFVPFHSARSGQRGRQIFWRNFRLSNER